MYILLTTRTNPNNSIAAYSAIKKAYPSWKYILGEPWHEIARHIRVGGLSNRKAKWIVDIFHEIHQREKGKLSLEMLRRMNDENVESYLTSLPGIDKKLARCVMMYSLGRKVFPLDTHCHRILKRMGLLKQRGDIRKSYDVVHDLVPPDIRYDLHVNLVAHGRSTCLPRTPSCRTCPVVNLCEHGGKTLQS